MAERRREPSLRVLRHRGLTLSASVASSAASVTPSGVAYAIRSDRNRGCGALGIRLVRYFAPGDPATGKVIAARRPGTTASRMFAVAVPTGVAGVFLDRESPCRTPIGVVPRSDLVKVVDPG